MKYRRSYLFDTRPLPQGFLGCVHLTKTAELPIYIFGRIYLYVLHLPKHVLLMLTNKVGLTTQWIHL